MGSAGKVLKAPVSNRSSGARVQRDRPATVGNFCRMRIIIDQFLLRLFDNNKEKVKNVVKYLEMSLNDIYSEAGVSVKVNDTELSLKFKVMDLQFHDEDYCRRNNYSPGNGRLYHI